MEKIIASIRTMDAITPRCDFVFTGGEPLADLDALQRMLDARHSSLSRSSGSRGLRSRSKSGVKTTLFRIRAELKKYLDEEGVYL